MKLCLFKDIPVILLTSIKKSFSTENESQRRRFAVDCVNADHFLNQRKQAAEVVYKGHLAVFRIRDMFVLIRIRILGPLHLITDQDSALFVSDLQYANKKSILFHFSLLITFCFCRFIYICLQR